MRITPINYQPKVILNSFKPQNNFVSFKGGQDVFVKEANNKPNKEEIKKAQGILEEAGVSCEQDKESGLLRISHYDKKVSGVVKNHKGISENDLLKSVITIDGDADFTCTKVKSLGSVESIEGDASFFNSRVTDIGKLKRIGKNADFIGSKIKSLNELETIGGHGDFWNASVEDLGKLKAIKGDADFRSSKIKSLGNLKTIGGSADFEYSELRNLGSLESIGENAYFGHSRVKNLGNLKFVGGIVYINNCLLEKNDFANVEIGNGIRS